MKIKRLEIVGFKSFVDKVSLDFQHGITGVVGPNGCGKSNIVDAIRWAMGEQNARHLRGRMMEDVIFGGSESRKPHGLAQVSIVFDNSAGLCPPAYKEFSEIMVTRCLHRSGDSEYRINKTPCRLLDITELFMDTGVGARAYSIIEQGKVGMLVSAKPEERRSLIEEAAGVTKYKARKKSALRKMDATRQNLVRLGDIITEVRRQIGSLKRQAQKAERFKDFRREVKRIELTLGGNRYQQLNREAELVATREKEQATVLSRLDARLEEGDLQVEERQLQLSSVESEYGQAQERYYHLGSEIQKSENELLLSRKQREHLSSQDLEVGTELERLKGKTLELEGESGHVVDRKACCEEKIEQFQRALDVESVALQETVTREQELHQQHEQARTELMELMSRANRFANRSEEITRTLSTETARREQVQKSSQDVCSLQEELVEERSELLTQLDRAREESSALKEQLEEWGRLHEVKSNEFKQQERVLTDLRQTVDRARSTVESLEALQYNREGYSEGARALLEADGNDLVAADFLRVSAEHETVVEIALGERLQAVKVDHDGGVKGALTLLDEKKLRASLLSPTTLSNSVEFKAGTPLVELVSPLEGYENLAAQLLSGIYAVPDVLSFLTQSLPAGVLLVDSSGRSLDWKGVLAGGDSRVDGSGLLRRQRKLDELSHEIKQNEVKLKAGESVYAQLEEELQEIQERRSGGLSESHRLDLQLVELGKDRQRLYAEEEHLNKRLSLIVHDLSQIDEGQKTLQDEQSQLQRDLTTIHSRREVLEEEVTILSNRLREERESLDLKREQLTNRKVAFASTQQELQALNDTIQRLGSQQEEIKQRHSQLLQRKADAGVSFEQLDSAEVKLKAELEVYLGRREVLQTDVDDTRQKYEQLRSSLEEFREQLRRVRSEAEDIRKTVAQLQLRQHELQVDTENIRQNVLERYRVDLMEHKVPEATDDEIERQQQQLKGLQQRIEALGEVNLMAIDEYREQEERYDFLNTQREDLNRSLDDLQKAISQINRTTRRRFKETFEQVNEKFRQVFPRLFRGGKAELRLTDENDLLETGIEIIVQPPGKRLQSVNLLSGGEKALTAVALIFSLFLIKPTPFCILDEVDAPLDDANIDRFAEIVREMTERSQFIVITHSKRTMSILDTMYGVTMQEPGVSKLVSVRLNELEADSRDPQPVSV